MKLKIDELKSELYQNSNINKNNSNNKNNLNIQLVI